MIPWRMQPVERFEAMLAAGRDSPLLRFSLGTHYLQSGDPRRAAGHLREAVARDPQYSAAWKALGKALAEAGERSEAIAAYREGMAVADRRGDKQAAREMGVFLRRLEKARDGESGT